MDYAAEYRRMHESPKSLAGYSLKRYLSDVVELVGRVRMLDGEAPESILDYGSGKGYQYLLKRSHERWGGPLPHCFDPGVTQLAGRPERKFGGLICTDVLEHIERGDVGWILDDMLGFIGNDRPAFAVLTASCKPARRKTLSDGRNAHVTIEPPEWWEREIRKALGRSRHPGLIVRACFDVDYGKTIERVDIEV